FFFFQAEDGIRDFHVTGVQTCALPISFDLQCTSQLEMLLDPHHVLTCRENCTTTGSVFHLRQSRPLADELGDDAFPSLQSPDNRSEERRVGNELISVWTRVMNNTSKTR